MKKKKVLKNISKAVGTDLAGCILIAPVDGGDKTLSFVMGKSGALTNAITDNILGNPELAPVFIQGILGGSDFNEN